MKSFFLLLNVVNFFLIISIPDAARAQTVLPGAADAVPQAGSSTLYAADLDRIDKDRPAGPLREDLIFRADPSRPKAGLVINATFDLKTLR